MKPIIIYLNDHLDDIVDMETIINVFAMTDLSVEDSLSISKLLIEHNNIVLSRQQLTIETLNKKIINMNRTITISNDSKETPHLETPPVINSEVKFEPLIVSYAEMLLNKDFDSVYDLIDKEKSSKSIYGQVLLYLYQELKLFIMLEQEPEDIDFIKNVINSTREHMDLSEFKTVKEAVPVSKYDIVLYRSNMNNIGIESDLADIDPVYYGEFCELINSIINGTLMNYRSFSGEKLKGVKEVKNDSCRLIFKIEDGKCVILNAFIKKTQRETACYERLCARLISYRHRKKTIMNNWKKEDDLKDLEEILKSLNDRKRLVL